MNVLGLISQLIGIETLRLTDNTLNFHEKTIVHISAYTLLKSWLCPFLQLERRHLNRSGSLREAREIERSKLVRARLAPPYRQFRALYGFSIMLKLL